MKNNVTQTAYKY